MLGVVGCFWSRSSKRLSAGYVGAVCHCAETLGISRTKTRKEMVATNLVAARTIPLLDMVTTL